MKRQWIWLLTIFIGSIGVAGAAPVAMVAQVNSGAQVKTGGRWSAARLRQMLSAGDQVKAGGSGNVALVMLKTGARYRLSAGQTATIGATTVSGATSIGGLKGPSARVAQSLGGARTGATFARAPQPPSRLKFASEELWISANDRRIAWDIDRNDKTSTQFLFSLFDGTGKLLWSTRTDKKEARYPATLAFSQRVPYIWKLGPFGKDGQRLPNNERWGIVAFLSDADAAQLRADDAEMKKQIHADPTDWSLLLLRSELFRNYGVLGRTIELLDNEIALTDQPEIYATLREAYAEVGPYAQFLSPLFNLVSSDAVAPPGGDAMVK